MAQQNDQNHQAETEADVRSTPNAAEHLDQIERMPASELQHGVVQPMPRFLTTSSMRCRTTSPNTASAARST